MLQIFTQYETFTFDPILNAFYCHHLNKWPNIYSWGLACFIESQVKQWLHVSTFKITFQCGTCQFIKFHQFCCIYVVSNFEKNNYQILSYTEFEICSRSNILIYLHCNEIINWHNYLLLNTESNILESDTNQGYCLAYVSAFAFNERKQNVQVVFHQF